MDELREMCKLHEVEIKQVRETTAVAMELVKQPGGSAQFVSWFLPILSGAKFALMSDEKLFFHLLRLCVNGRG